MNLSKEQDSFIEKALAGFNIIVDACIGSGKTTTINILCNKYTEWYPNKKILYFTYNKLLKLDAQEKIKNQNVEVTNYHSYAYQILKKYNITTNIQDLLPTLLKGDYNLNKYDLLIIDEYQDINLEISQMLTKIKNQNPNLQIIAVGDMKQKIYDFTTLDIWQFINDFITDNILIEFTKCFRLNKDHANRLGKIWEKEINGVNENCEILEMSKNEIIEFLAKKDTSEILCLGSTMGEMIKILNKLESTYPDKFNKKTTFASIDPSGRSANIKPNSQNAIFTTFDGSKGLERPICVITDFTQDYWHNRQEIPNTKYEILRNIFCVAASRGKNKIIFLKSSKPLTDDILSTPFDSILTYDNMFTNIMLNFKFKEDVDNCYNELKIIKIQTNNTSLIDIKNKDNLIDLSPCINIYQKAVFFENFNIDDEIDCLEQELEITERDPNIILNSLDKKILYLTSLQTTQSRYYNQIQSLHISENTTELVKQRLSEHFNTNDDINRNYIITFGKNEISTDFKISGTADIIKDDKAYTLIFNDQLSHEHFIISAVNMLGSKQKEAFILNIKTNDLYEIQIPDLNLFLDKLITCITKGVITKYYGSLLPKNTITNTLTTENIDKPNIKTLNTSKNHLISEELINDILTEYDQGLSTIDLSKKYNINPNAIAFLIKQRKSKINSNTNK